MGWPPISVVLSRQAFSFCCRSLTLVEIAIACYRYRSCSRSRHTDVVRYRDGDLTLTIDRCARVVDRGLLAAYLVLEVSSAKERMISHLSDVELSISIP